jgi:excinuclease ABC subunit A
VLKSIKIEGAKLHNLKNISVEIPHNKLTVITGVSGSGKSTLAFDTIYAEGQRRFVESLSSYARQFLERMSKPDADKISGILPAVAIDQKSPSKNPRSTVGTSTEIYDYIRLLYGRIGVTICRSCGKEVKSDSPQSAADDIIERAEGDKLYIMFPCKDGSKLSEEIDKAVALGFFRFYDSKTDSILNAQEDKMPKYKDASKISVLVDRVVARNEEESKSRLTEALESAFANGEGRVLVRNISKNETYKFSSIFECADCDIRYIEPEPRLFSFNNPFGACHVCQGFGKSIGIDEDLVVPDKTKTLSGNPYAPWKTQTFKAYYQKMIYAANRKNIPLTTPYMDLKQSHKEYLWVGDDEYAGVLGFFKMLEDNNQKMTYRILLSKYRGYTQCKACGGSRIRTSARQVFVAGKNIPELVKMPIGKLYEHFMAMELNEHQLQIAAEALKEIRRRIALLVDIGLEYLTLDRLTHTLSGGEAQRINLSSAIGSALTSTLYVLDEPSIGLHPRDTDRLNNILQKLKSLGNTVIVVEHDPDIMKEADYIIDMGPKAGELGGEVQYAGEYKGLAKSKTLTAKYLKGDKKIKIDRKEPDFSNTIVIKEPRENNLRMSRVEIPLNCMTVITGVSGSGKSTLVHDIIYTGIKKAKGQFVGAMYDYEGIEGLKNIDNIEMVDQTPIGRSSRSTPITYTKAFDAIREVFADTLTAKQAGFKPGYFSFNIPGGRCEVCEGEGSVSIDMQFLPDIRLECEACKGTRYKKEIRNILYKGKSIVDVLDMTVDTAIEFFKDDAKIIKKLVPLQTIGLGYLRLGQPGSTLSGGEAQRVKLANYIDVSSNGRTLYVFDEPTTGLHMDDISKLLLAINKLVKHGHSVLVIEHNLHVIANADWIIDLGPEGGSLGGKIVAVGRPEQIAEVEDSYTGRALKEFFANAKSK